MAQDQLNWSEEFSLNRLIAFLEDVNDVSGDEFKDILKVRIQNLKDFKDRIVNLAKLIDDIMKKMDLQPFI